MGQNKIPLTRLDRQENSSITTDPFQENYTKQKCKNRRRSRGELNLNAQSIREDSTKNLVTELLSDSEWTQKVKNRRLSNLKKDEDRPQKII